MVTRASKLRQSIEASSNSDDQSVIGLEEVEGRGGQHKISFEAALAHRTHVEYRRRLATLAQTV